MQAHSRCWTCLRLHAPGPCPGQKQHDPVNTPVSGQEVGAQPVEASLGPGFDETATGQSGARGPMTNAERQAAWRSRHREAVLVLDRERKRLAARARRG